MKSLSLAVAWVVGRAIHLRRIVNTMLAYIQQNGDVWAYATWWGAGDRWGNYFMSLEPGNVSQAPPGAPPHP